MVSWGAKWEDGRDALEGSGAIKLGRAAISSGAIKVSGSGSAWILRKSRNMTAAESYRQGDEKGLEKTAPCTPHETWSGAPPPSLPEASGKTFVPARYKIHTAPPHQFLQGDTENFAAGLAEGAKRNVLRNVVV